MRERRERRGEEGGTTEERGREGEKQEEGMREGRSYLVQPWFCSREG